MSRVDDFEEELRRIVRRANRLRAAISGDATIKRVHVAQSNWVKRHRRKAHTRIVIVLNKPTRRATK